MTIIDDIMTFQAADFSALSPLAVKAVQALPGSTSALLARLSAHVTLEIKQAKDRYIKDNASNNADVSLLLRKFAAADAPTLAAAADEISALSAALGPTPP